MNNDVLLTFASKDNESGLSGLSIYERITTGIKAMTQKTLTGEPTAEVTYTDREEGTRTYYGKAVDNANTTSGSPSNHETDTANLTVHTVVTMQNGLYGR